MAGVYAAAACVVRAMRVFGDCAGADDEHVVGWPGDVEARRERVSVSGGDAGAVFGEEGAESAVALFQP